MHVCQQVNDTVLYTCVPSRSIVRNLVGRRKHRSQVEDRNSGLTERGQNVCNVCVMYFTNPYIGANWHGHIVPQIEWDIEVLYFIVSTVRRCANPVRAPVGCAHQGLGAVVSSLVNRNHHVKHAKVAGTTVTTVLDMMRSLCLPLKWMPLIVM